MNGWRMGGSWMDMLDRSWMDGWIDSAVEQEQCWMIVSFTGKKNLLIYGLINDSATILVVFDFLCLLNALAPPPACCHWFSTRVLNGRGTGPISWERISMKWIGMAGQVRTLVQFSFMATLSRPKASKPASRERNVLQGQYGTVRFFR